MATLHERSVKRQRGLPSRTMDFDSEADSEDPRAGAEEVNYNWVDITGEFMSCIEELELGELLHDELFGLFDAMSAIEMMDPKMDAGMHCNRGNTKPLTFEQSVEVGKLKLDNLTPSELIGIIDATYACIVSWLEGHSLPQTVFTNLYLHQPHKITDKTLKAFCIAVYKILELIKKYIGLAQVVEEEDFQLLGYTYRSNSQGNGNYDYELVQDISEQKCISALREQEDDLNRRSRNNQDGEYLIALFARIRFTRMFYQTLTLLTKRDQQSINDCIRLLSGCSGMMTIIKKTIDKGTQPDENSDMPNPMGFEPLINQRNLPPTFPRYTKIKPRPDALQYFDDLITRLRTSMKITTITSFHSVLDFFIEFSKNQPCILSRSALQILYLGGVGNPITGAIVPEALREAIRTFINPLVPRHHFANNPILGEYVDNFLNRCARPFTTLLQVCGHNRARQRDKLAHLLDDFAALQEEAETIDDILRSLSVKADVQRPMLPCFGTWILYHVLRIMIMYLLSGFELELYSVHEYHYIFWYLYDFLYEWLCSALNRAETILVEQEAVSNMNNASSTSGNSGGRRSSKGQKHKKRTAPRPTQREVLMCQIMQNMCGGYYKALVAFQLQGKIPQPIPEFDNEAIRYEHRFAPLSVMTPRQVQYKDFKEMTMLYNNPKNLYAAGCKHFQQARTLMTSIPNCDQEITDLMKIAKTNFVVLKLLYGGHKNDAKTRPDFDFSLHKHFPILKI